MFNRRGPT